MAPKSFVDPRSCLSVFNHYCLLPLRQPSLVHITVNADIARSHHYRQCNFGIKTCSEYFAQETQDDVALRFKRRLQPAVESVLHELGTYDKDRPNPKDRRYISLVLSTPTRGPPTVTMTL